MSLKLSRRFQFGHLVYEAHVASNSADADGERRCNEQKKAVEILELVLAFQASNPI